MNDLGPLSERELDVLKLVATGATNQQIARALVISPNTVKVHLRNIFEKLNVQSRTEATMEAVRRGWVPVATAVLLPPAEQAAAASAPAAPIIVVPPIPARPPLRAWQYVYMVVALVMAVLAAALPAWRRGQQAVASPTLFTDVNQAQVASPLRAEVNRWRARAPLPSARSRLALASDGQKLYAIGGETMQGVTAALDIYDPQSNGWLSGPDKPTAVANVAAVLLGDRIYVPGGSTPTGGVTNVLEVYDIPAATWQIRAPLPAAVAGYGLAAFQGKLYLFGGWDGERYRAESYVYDPIGDGWTAIAPLSTPRAFLAAGAVESLLYVVGGYDGQRELDTVLAYDPTGEGTAAGPWMQRSPMAQPRAGLGMTVIGRRLYVVGGGWQSALQFSEQYDTQLDAWSRIGTPLVGEWRNLGVAALDNMVYAVGGWSRGYLTTNEQYQALIRQLLPLGSSGG